MTSLIRPVARVICDALDRACCRLVGHDDSWTHGFALGYERPCCERCHRVA